ncbi:unnamed protein product [Sphagnum tenellum]
MAAIALGHRGDGCNIAEGPQGRPASGGETLRLIVEGGHPVRQADDEVKAVLEEMRYMNDKQRYAKMIDYTDPELKIRHAFVAGYREDRNVWLMYMVYQVEATLTKTGLLTLFSGKSVKLTPEELELLKNTLMTHKLMKELHSRNVIKSIEYVE